MTKKLIITGIIILSMLVLSAELIDKIVAHVGSDVILLSDLQNQLIQMRSAGVREELLNPEMVLNNMIEHRVMIQKARELKIAVDERAIKSHAENYIAQIKSQYDSEAAFRADLKAMNTSERDLQKYIIEQLTEQFLTEQLVQKQISARVNVSEGEMREFYSANRDTIAVKPESWDLSLIMREVLPSPDSRQEIYELAQRIQARANFGEDFANLAETFSDCPSKSQGGDLGFFGRGMMVKPFEDAAFALDINEISQIVETDFGFHIIKLLEKKGDEVRASHILKTLEAQDTDFEREKSLMDSLRTRILAGEDFSTLAQSYSMDAESAADGGFLGEFTEEELPELFAAPLSVSAVGQPTEVLKHGDMYYIFLKTLEHAPGYYSFEELRPQLKAYLSQLKEKQAFEDWIAKAKADSFIQIKL